MPELSAVELAARVLLAAAFGGAIGLEREFSDQPAGFRTHILVSLGAALFTMVGAYGVASFEDVEGVRFDPTRIAAQVVTGIGFLGAGAIIQRGVSVRGLTTAAALWVTAAIGTAVGLGYLSGATMTTVVTLISLVLLRQFERRLMHRFKRGRVRFVIDGTEEFQLVAVINTIDTFGGRLESIKHAEEEEQGHRFVVLVQLPSNEAVDALMREIRELEGVQNVDRSA
ncbi:MAG TPA: MgtC/SapB family protein [Actinomycetota bacterium]|nr:MgtC/SapB family protein [Actinomycetota bacterium]